jgi:hypothetical protein
MPDGKRAADRLAKQRKGAWDRLTTALQEGDNDTAWAERAKVLALYTWPQLFRTEESNMIERRKLLEKAEKVLGAPDWPWHQSYAVAYDYVTQRVLCNPQTGDYVHSVGYAASVNEVFDSLLASARTAEAPDRLDLATRRTFPMRTEKFGEDAEQDAGWWAWKCFQWTTDKARLHLWIRVENYNRPCYDEGKASESALSKMQAGQLLTWAAPETAVAGCTDMVKAWKALMDQHEQARTTAEGLLQKLQTQDPGKLFVIPQTSGREKRGDSHSREEAKGPESPPQKPREEPAYPSTPENDLPYMAPSPVELQQQMTRSKEMQELQGQALLEDQMQQARADVQAALLEHGRNFRHMQQQQHQQQNQPEQQQMFGVPIFVPMMYYPQHAMQQQWAAEKHYEASRRSWTGLSPNIDPRSVIERLKEDHSLLSDSMSTNSGWIDGESSCPSLADSGGCSLGNSGGSWHRRM